MATDSQGRLGAEHRKTIRSHVMRGKNTRQGVPRKRRRTQTIVEGQNSTENVSSVQFVSCSDFPNSQALLRGRSTSPDWRQWELLSVPRTPHDLSLVKFCEDLDSNSMGKIVYCKTPFLSLSLCAPLTDPSLRQDQEDNLPRRQVLQRRRRQHSLLSMAPR
jgi:hypothetical protein